MRLDTLEPVYHSLSFGVRFHDMLLAICVNFGERYRVRSELTRR